MSDSEEYRECHMVPKFRVELESGDEVELTLADCERIINTLMYHRLVQFEVNVADRTLMRRDIGEWEMFHVDATKDGCWKYDDCDTLNISLTVNDETLRGGLPREEFRNTHLPKASDN